MVQFNGKWKKLLGLLFRWVAWPTCESNSRFAFLTLSWLPFSRLLDPGGKCMYMSDVQGTIRTASRQPQTDMVPIACYQKKTIIIGKLEVRWFKWNLSSSTFLWYCLLICCEWYIKQVSCNCHSKKNYLAVLSRGLWKKTYSWDHHSGELCSALLCCGTVYDAAKGGSSHTRSSILSIDQNGLLFR